MLHIDNKKIEIIKQLISVGEFTKNCEKGYNINIQLEFVNIDSNEKGYINLDVGFEKKDDIKVFLNREYSGTPFDSNDNQYIFFEIFDTERFLDTEIEGKITVKLKDMKDNKIGTSFEVDDELIKIKYDGYLEIDFSRTRDTFLGS